MTKIKFKINLLITMIILIITSIIIFIDTETLNSLYIKYDNNNLVINEVKTKPKEENNEKEHITNVEKSNVSLINNPINKWVWPTISNYVITGYYSYYHNALDIASGHGSDIYAANYGVVTSVKGGCTVGDLYCNGRGGNYIVIKHNTNNYYTVYMHLKDIYVSVGDVVTSGQVIGTMGNTGNVIPVPTSYNPYAGTHLHFCLYIGEPYKGGYAINPMNLY